MHKYITARRVPIFFFIADPIIPGIEKVDKMKKNLACKFLHLLAMTSFQRGRRSSCGGLITFLTLHPAVLG